MNNLPPAILATISEDDVEKDVRKLLPLLGYIVLKNSVKIRSRDPQAHRTGQSKGCPDILVSHPSWAYPVWIGIELKAPSKRNKFSSPEQAELARSGRNIVVTSAQEALEVCRKVSAFIGGQRNAEEFP